MSAGGKERRRASYSAAAVASQESTVTRSSNPLRAWAGAKLVLKNESDYLVSYWVVHEDKLSSKAVKRRVFRNIEDDLNHGGSDLTYARHDARNAKRGWDVINAEHALDNEVAMHLLRNKVGEGCACTDCAARLSSAGPVLSTSPPAHN